MKTSLLAALAAVLVLAGCTDAALDAPPTADGALERLDAETAVSMRRGVGSGKVKAPAADLEVEVLASNSDFINHLYLVGHGPDLFLGTDDETGRVTALPTVRRNAELVFEIRVHDPANVPLGDVWRTGPPSRNADRARHALVEHLPGSQIRVSFEDLPATAWGTADEPNYVDAVILIRPRP